LGNKFMWRGAGTYGAWGAKVATSIRYGAVEVLPTKPWAMPESTSVN